MRFYAHGLAASLGDCAIDVNEVNVQCLLPAGLRRGPLSRVDSLWGRFVRYPLAARCLKGDVFHIVDHAQAHLVAALDPARTVITCHDLILLVLSAGLLPTLHREPLPTFVFRHSVSHLSRAARVVAVSESTRKDLIHHLGVDAARIDVIPPGYDPVFRPRTEQARDALRRKLGVSRPVVLHVGQTAFYKNVEGCLRIMASVRAQGVDASLVRIGEPLRRHQRALAHQLGLTSHVLELGRVGIEALSEWYSAADALLFPSLYEGFGSPPLEAMASGLPVVCSNAGGLAEVASDAAITAPPNDVAALAQAVAETLTSPARARDMRERGLRVAARYSWKATAREMVRIYERVSRS